jgi:hypothetical protein
MSAEAVLTLASLPCGTRARTLRRDRDPERLLAAQLDDEPAALLAHLGQVDEPLAALDRDHRLVAVDRLDVDLADRDLDLELGRLRCVEAVLAHLRSRGWWWGGGCA